MMRRFPIVMMSVNVIRFTKYLEDNNCRVIRLLIKNGSLVFL